MGVTEFGVDPEPRFDVWFFPDANGTVNPDNLLALCIQYLTHKNVYLGNKLPYLSTFNFNAYTLDDIVFTVVLMYRRSASYNQSNP